MPTTNPSTLHPNPSLAALPHNPALSLWLSVDPLSDKYPGVSPYVYCADNPVRLVDPNGEDFTNFEDENGNLIKHIDDGSNAVFKLTGAKTSLHYEFSRFDNSQGGENEVNLTTAIQEQQILNDGNQYLAEHNNNTYCNYATQNVLKTVASIPELEQCFVSGNANQMCDAFAQNDRFLSVNEQDAKRNAQTGHLVILAYKNPNGHGHVATFCVGDNASNDQVIANIGPKKYSGFVSINQTISSKKERTYYVF